MLQEILTMIFLLICSYVDIRYQRVEKKIAVGYAVFVIAGRIYQGKSGMLSLLIGLIPGIFFLLLSFLTNQGIGYGDSILILILGAAVGFSASLEILLFAFFLSGIWAIVLLFRGHGNRKQEFPFVPFLFAGVLLRRLLLN